jgi:hypothetical protein
VRGWRSLVRTRVMVNLTTGAVFDGILWQARGGLLVLREASIHEPRGERPWRKVDGEVVVEVSRVEFVQVVPTPAPAPLELVRDRPAAFGARY